MWKPWFVLLPVSTKRNMHWLLCVAGSVLHLNHGVWNVYKNSNIPLYECVNCASLNPATAIGIADRKGSLDIGKDADIVITDENFEVMTTIIRGETKYEA